MIHYKKIGGSMTVEQQQEAVELAKIFNGEKEGDVDDAIRRTLELFSKAGNGFGASKEGTALGVAMNGILMEI
jgi:hypothetical protein